jgi:hypothetical protein
VTFPAGLPNFLLLLSSLAALNAENFANTPKTRRDGPQDRR